MTGVAKDDIDVELNEGRLSICVNVEESEENEGKNFLQKEFSSYSATRGVYLKDASSEAFLQSTLTASLPLRFLRLSRRRTLRRFPSTNAIGY